MRPPGGILAPGESIIATGKYYPSNPKLLFSKSRWMLATSWLSLLQFVMYLAVFKFVEPPENNEKPIVDQKSRVKFKIMSLKVKGEMDYVPELVLKIIGLFFHGVWHQCSYFIHNAFKIQITVVSYNPYAVWRAKGSSSSGANFGCGFFGPRTPKPCKTIICYIHYLRPFCTESYNNPKNWFLKGHG